MGRGLPASFETAVAQPITGPYYLVLLGWDTPAAYSSIGNLTFIIPWTAANLEVNLGPRPRLTFFNEDLAFGNLVMAQGTAGRAVTIYQGDQGDANHPSPVMVFSGVMGPADIQDATVTIECKQYDPTKNFYIAKPTFNHLPKAGTRIETASGDVIILEAQ